MPADITDKSGPKDNNPLVKEDQTVQNQSPVDSANQQRQDLSEVPESEEILLEKSYKKYYILGTAILILVVAAGAGFYYFSSQSTSDNGVETEIIQPQTEEPSPSPQRVQKTLNRGEWQLEVLNGSGIKGAAKKLADQLEELGYKIVKVGNADTSDYEDNEIYILGKMMDQTDLFLEDLESIIKISSVSGELEDSTSSARIIIGKEL